MLSAEASTMKSIPFWLLAFPLLAITKIALTLLGFIVVPLALPFAKVVASSKEPPYPEWQYKVLPQWANFIWGNDKYGAMGNKTQVGEFFSTTSFMAQLIWLAWDNPAYNLHNYSWFAPVLVAEKIYGTVDVNDAQGKAGCQLVLCGWLAGFYWIVPYGNNRCLRIRLGYKIGNTLKRSGLSVLINPYNRFGK